MHGLTRSRHADIKLRLVGLAEGFDRYADNHLVDRLALGGVTGDSYSLVDMESSSQNDLAFVERQLPLTHAHHRMQFVVPKLLSLALEILRYANPVTHR